MSPQDVIDSLALWGLISSIVSIGIAAFAVWLGWLFYRQGRDTETRLETALAQIKAQTETLQKITGSQIKTLTRAVTQQSPTEKALLDTLAKMAGGTTDISNIKAPSDAADIATLRAELISSYITIHFYTAVANNALTYLAPSITDDAILSPVFTMMNGTYDDFQHMEGIMKQLTPAELEASPFAHLYRSTEDDWKPRVMNAARYKAAVNAPSNA